MKNQVVRFAPSLLACAIPLATLADPVTDSAEEAQGVLAQIIVTADRRPIDMQALPLTVSVMTERDIRAFALRDTVDLTSIVPGLHFSQQGMGATPFIRGVGTTSGAIGNEAPVSMYVDGVYIAAPTASIFSLAGIHRIEVLKGPQGTLFGRNATGGVIQIETNDPVPEPSAEILLAMSNYSTARASIYATSGLGQSTAANISLHYAEQRNGWGTNLSTGVDTFRHEETGARAKFEWTPGSRTRLLLGASHFDRRGEDGLGYHILPGALGLDGETGYSGFYDAWADPQDSAEYRHDTLSARLEHEHGSFRLVNILSWQQLHAFFQLDQDATPARIVEAPITQYGRTITEELQLMSTPDSPWPWIVGIYYFRDTAAYDPLALLGGAVQPFTSTEIRSLQRSDSYAVYGQTTFNLGRGSRLTFGGRYTRDERSMDGATSGTLEGDRITIGTAGQSDVWEKPTWRIAFSQDLGPDVMAYVSWDRGFKSGVYNLLSYANPPVNPEVLDAFQAGVKSDWLQHRLRLNANAFFYDYRNIQVESIVAGATIAVNAAAARLRGVEIDAEYLPISALRVRASMSLLDGRYTDFKNAPFHVPNRDGDGNLVGGNIAVSGDATGHRTVRSPRTSMMLGALYRLPTRHGVYGMNFAYAYSTRFAWDPDNRVQQQAYGTLSASLDWSSPGETMTLRLLGSNLTNREVCVQANATAVADICSPRAPRILSVELSTKF